MNHVGLSNNFVAISNQWKSWYTARILCFNKNFKKIVPFQQPRVSSSVASPKIWVGLKNWGITILDFRKITLILFRTPPLNSAKWLNVPNISGRHGPLGPFLATPIRVRIPNFGVKCINDSIWLLVFLGIRLHPKTSDSLRLRIWNAVVHICFCRRNLGTPRVCVSWRRLPQSIRMCPSAECLRAVLRHASCNNRNYKGKALLQARLYRRVLAFNFYCQRSHTAITTTEKERLRICAIVFHNGIRWTMFWSPVYHNPC